MLQLHSKNVTKYLQACMDDSGGVGVGVGVGGNVWGWGERVGVGGTSACCPVSPNLTTPPPISPHLPHIHVY